MTEVAGTAGASGSNASTTSGTGTSAAGAASGNANASAAGATGAAGAAGASGTGGQQASGSASADPSAAEAARTGETGAGANWGADWREKYADKDEKKLNVLKRYDSPRAALDALFAARQKIDSGELKSPLPANPTPEQLTQFRKDNGIPEKPEGYFEKLPAELKVEDGDKAVLTPYLAAMHELNLPPDTAHKLLAVRAAQIDKMIETRVQEDQQLQTATEDRLRSEWGNDYRANINNIHSMLKSAPPEVTEAFLSARTPDGNPLFGTPEAVQWFAQLARTINPFSTVVGSGSGSIFDGKGVDDRITEIEKLMGDRGSDYWKGPRSDKMQQEYRDLLDRRELMRKRAAA